MTFDRDLAAWAALRFLGVLCACAFVGACVGIAVTLLLVS